MNADLLKLAKSDIARARRCGTLLVTGTTRGTVTLSRTDAGGFKLIAVTASGDDTVELANGAGATVAPVLAALY